MTRIQRRILTGLLLTSLLLAACWGLYVHTQAILSHQLAHLAEQSLPSDGPAPGLSIQGQQATGWPFGAWRRLRGVAFHTHLNGADIAGATPSLVLGGNWLDWARALTTQDKLPLHMPGNTILRLVRNGESLTLRLQAARLRISRGRMPCPPGASICTRHGTMPLYRAHLHMETLEMASSRLPHGVTLQHLAGTIRFAPQPLSRHDPALQDRSLLSASLSATRLSSPALILRDFSMEQVRAQFALLPAPVALPPGTPALTGTSTGKKTDKRTDGKADNMAGPEQAATTPHPSPWPGIPLRLRVHELSATIRPLAPEERGPPPPRLSLGGELYVPAFSGVMSVMLTNWQSPLHLLAQSLWFQQVTPPATRSLLHELMNSPKMENLATHPLTFSLPLDHAMPPGLSSRRLQGLYDQLRRMAPPHQ